VILRMKSTRFLDDDEQARAFALTHQGTAASEVITLENVA
jgi:hypothetical protein